MLLFAILMTWFYVTAPTPEEIERQRTEQDSINQARLAEENIKSIQEDPQAPVTPVPDTARSQQLSQSFGDFSKVMVGQNERVTLENDKVKITMATKGGRIIKAILKDYYKLYDDAEGKEKKELLSLFEDTKNRFEYIIPTKNHGPVSTSDLFFTPQASGNTVTFRADLGNGTAIEQVYTLRDDSYVLDYKVNLTGFSQVMDPSSNALKLRWHHYLDKIEKNYQFEKYYSTVYFKQTGEDSDYCSCRGDDREELGSGRIDWFSHVNQFFNTTLMAGNTKFENGVFETVMLDKEDPDLKLIKSEVDLPLAMTLNESLDYTWFIGPNEFKALRQFDNGLEEVIPFGRSIFGTINRWMIRPFFDWLSGFISSKGIVIIVLIFIIKMALYPLMYKMLYSQAKMAALKPELAALKQKYKDDQQKVQMETMSIYREYGVSPLGGCMPMLLQMPIWYALFRFFPASLTFRQEPFLWANDLSSYDVLFNLPFTIPAFGSHVSLFTLLWAVTTIIYSYYNMKHMDFGANPAMKYVQYFMPITFLVFFNTYASGLTCYMFFSNLMNILQTIISKKFIFDDDKIREELEIKKKKPKKKGGFQARLEEAMKKQQEVQKQRMNKQKKKK